MWCGLVLVLGSLAPPASDEALVELVWSRAADLQAQRAKVALAAADAERAGLLPNPGLDVSYNTIPIGPHNPVTEPFFNIPNLQVGVSELVELGKRGPRQDATALALKAAKLDALSALRDRFFDVKELYTDIATAQARIASFTQLVDGAKRLRELEEVRATGGETSTLELDRARLEEEKLKSNLAEERERLIAGLRACSVTLNDECEPFADAQAATRFLEEAAALPSNVDVAQRPDLLSLDAQAASARASRTLAERRLIPDLNLRFGYVRDWFVVSGNQPHSLFVGVSMPLPVFDRGQADARAATAVEDASQRAKQLLQESAERGLKSATTELSAYQERLARLRTNTLPLSMHIVERLSEAVARGAAPVQDLILARRTYEELSIDALDLELATSRLSLSRARLSGVTPPAPRELTGVVP
ncbi:MAG: TolC family protein [Myxococcaceae bacterium]